VTRVLFVCVQNAGRSQMSEALFMRAAGGRPGGGRSARVCLREGRCDPQPAECA